MATNEAPLDTLVSKVKQSIDSDIQDVTGKFAGEFSAGRSDVDKETYYSYRRATYMLPKARERWLQQVGPEKFLQEYFDAFKVPEPVRAMYKESIAAGLTHEQATYYANALGYGIPSGTLMPREEGPPSG